MQLRKRVSTPVIVKSKSSQASPRATHQKKDAIAAGLHSTTSSYQPPRLPEPRIRARSLVHSKSEYLKSKPAVTRCGSLFRQLRLRSATPPKVAYARDMEMDIECDSVLGNSASSSISSDTSCRKQRKSSTPARSKRLPPARRQRPQRQWSQDQEAMDIFDGHTAEIEIKPPVDADEFFEVQKIKGHKFMVAGGKIELLVKWVGYKEETWEPIKNLEGSSSELLAEYSAKYFTL